MIVMLVLIFRHRKNTERESLRKKILYTNLPQSNLNLNRNICIRNNNAIKCKKVDVTTTCLDCKQFSCHYKPLYSAWSAQRLCNRAVKRHNDIDVLIHLLTVLKRINYLPHV